LNLLRRVGQDNEAYPCRRAAAGRNPNVDLYEVRPMRRARSQPPRDQEAPETTPETDLHRHV